MDLIMYRGRVVALVGLGGLHLVPELAERPAGDPELVFVAFMCAYAIEVRLGRVPGPYDDKRAALFARFALIDDEEFRLCAGWCDTALARRFRVPVGEIARKLADLGLERRGAGPSAWRRRPQSCESRREGSPRR
jgi:hypothetical protein